MVATCPTSRFRSEEMATVGISSSLEVSDEDSELVIVGVEELVSMLSDDELAGTWQADKTKVPISRNKRFIFFFIIDY